MAGHPVRQALRSLLIRTVPRTRLISSLPPEQGAVALTFDDGPHPELTPRLLDLLAAHGAHATFFVIGREAERQPALVRRIAAEGHAVGHHSWSHSEPASTPARVLLAESRRTRELLEDLLGRPAPLFRPPHGKVTTAKLLGAWRQRNTVVLWNRDPKDFEMRNARELEAWFAKQPLKAGDVVLLHDTHPHALGALATLLPGSPLRYVALQAP